METSALSLHDDSEQPSGEIWKDGDHLLQRFRKRKPDALALG